MNQVYLFWKKLFFLWLLIAWTFQVNAQEITVAGQVTSAEDGSAIPGVNILHKGTNNGTVTDIEGNYSISVPSDAILVFTSIGFLAQEMPVNGQTSLSIQLSADVQQLSEVVVIGYGSVKKSDLTGAVTSVREEDFNKGVFTSPDQLLQGKAAGVQIFNNDGTPGGSSTVRIRGNSSVRTGNQPLYVVDGIPLDGRSAKPSPGEIGGSGSGQGDSGDSNPLNFLNPNDIASMEVLKDASATAIYGSRGANGVIIITTKKGASGDPKIDFGASFGVSSILREIDILDGDGYRSALDDYGLTVGDFGGNEDAMDAVFRTATTQNYNISVSGGSDKGSYRVSTSYLDQDGIIEDSGIKKYTASLNGSYDFFDNDRFSVDFNVFVAHTDENIAPVTNNAGFTGDVLGQALQWNPTRPLRLANGQFDIELGSTTINPLAYLAAYDDEARVTTVLASVSPSFKITDNLVYKLLVSLNRSTGVRETQIRDFINVQGVEGRGWASYGTNELNTQQYTQTLSYNTEITSGISLNAVVGYEFQQFDNKRLSFSGKDFLTDELSYLDILQNSSQESRTIFTHTDGRSQTDPSSKLQSFFGRANVNINSKYLLTATVRADGSSKFGENNRYGVFPSFAVAWNLTNEEFLSTGSFDNLKLRLGWGQTGNQEFPAGAAQERFQLGSDGTFTGLENVANPDLQWETSTTINAGVDFAVFGAKLTGSIDYFHKTTKDLLFNFSTIQPAPAGRFWTNLDGQVINKGVELALNGLIISKEELSLEVGVNTSFLSNELQDYNGPAVLTGELHGQGISNTTIQRLESDQPLNSFYLREWLGFNETGFDNLTDDGNSFFYLGDPNPDVLLGLNTNLSYKNFSFVMNFNGAFGHQIYNNTLNTVIPIGNLGSRNVGADLIGGPIREDQANSIKASSRYLEDGDYLKMTNFSISYSLDDVISGIRNVRISLTGQNLFVLTDFSGFDPEVNTDKSRDGVPSFGIEYTPYPTPRTFILGLNFSF